MRVLPSADSTLGETIKRLRREGLVNEGHNYTEEVGNALKQLRKEGRIGILLVEQYLDFCLDVGDRFYVMERGSIVAHGAISELGEDIVKKYLTV